MAVLKLTVNALHKSELEYHGKFGHNIGRMQHISLMSRIVTCYTAFHLETQNVAPNLPGFQGIKSCIKYLTTHPHKPIFYPSNYYDGSNFIILIWSGNQFIYYTTHNCLECHQYADRAIIINRRWSVSGIIRTLLGISV